MIEISKVSFSYGAPVLFDVELTLHAGETCALIGKNGCGKSTLLRLVANQARCGSGEILLDGKKYSSFRGKEFAKRVGFFAQTRPVPQMTVGDYVAYGRYPHTDIAFRLSDADREAIAHALSVTKTENFVSRPVAELSGGERQLVYLAQLIAQGADHLLLDEPTAFADVKNSFFMAQILREQSEAGKCVLAAVHDIPLALSFFDRVAVMSEGKIIADGSPDMIVQIGAIDRAFGVTCERAGGGFVLKQQHLN